MADTSRIATAAPTAPPPPATPLVASGANPARSSLAVSAGFLVNSLLGGALALLVGIVVGVGPDTDAYFAAYSIYLFFGLYGTGLRITLVPLLGAADDEVDWRQNAADVLGRLVGVGLVITGVVVVLSPGLARAITPGLSGNARVTAAVCLAILTLASYCQIASGALASALAAVRRFPASAALLVSGTVLTLIFGVVLMSLVGVIGAATGVF